MDESAIQRRYIELAERAYHMGRYVYTDFLSISELDLFNRTANAFSHVPYTLWGGAVDCERKLVCFGSQELCGYEEKIPITCVCISPVNNRFADELTHRDFLGAIMNLGIERDTIGDIRVIENKGYIFCLSHISEFIIEQLTTVRRTTVSGLVVDELAEDFTLKTEPIRMQTASERLDVIVANLYKLSRADGQGLFFSGRIFVNDKQQKNNSYRPEKGDVISVRGYGKFVYRGVSGLSKKGKCIIDIEKYV